MIRSERYITSNKDLSHAEQSLLRKGPSRTDIPAPTGINWYNLRRDFDSFVNKLRYRVLKPRQIINHTTNMSNSLVC